MKTFMALIFIVTPFYMAYAQVVDKAPAVENAVRVAPSDVRRESGEQLGAVLDQAITDQTIVVNLESKNETDNASAKDLAETVEGSGIDCKKLEFTCPAPSNGQPGNFAFFESFIKWEPEPQFQFGAPLALEEVVPQAPMSQWVINSETKAPLSKVELCTCLKNNTSSPDLDILKKEEERKIKAKIRQSMNEKALNNYANHFEDVRFYSTNSPSVFHEDVAKQRSAVFKVQCMNPENFIDAMKDNRKCKNHKLSPDDRDMKLNTILKSFDPKLKGDFYTNIRKIQRQIFNNSADPSQAPGWEARRKFDERRLVLIKASSFVKSSDKILSKLMGSETFKTAFATKQLVTAATPMDTIFEVLREEFKSGKIRDLLDKESLGNDIFTQLESDIASDNPGPFLNLIASTFTKASGLHPGFDRLMKNPDLFSDVLEKVKSPLTAVNVIDTDDLMKDHFEDSCKKVTADFAEIACSTDDELLSRVSERELNKCIEQVGASKTDSPRIQSLIKCDAILEARTEAVGGSLFEIPGDRSSQYRSLVTKTEEPSINRIISATPSNSSSILDDALKKAEELFGKAPSAYDGHDNVAKEVFGKEYQPKPNTAFVESKTNSKSTQSEKASNESVSAQIAPESRQDALVDQPNYSGSNNSVIPSVSGTPNSSSSAAKVDTAKEMREFLADENAKESAAKLVKDSSDDVMNELIRLKEETEKNKIRILELSSDNEKLKLQAAEAQLNKLQKERAALNPGEPVIAEPAELTKKDKIFQPSTVRENSRDVASISQGETGTATAGASPASQVSASAVGSLGNLNRALLASSGLRGVDSSERVVVSSATTRPASLEIKSQDVGLDLLNYISSKDADIQTLIKLKTSGIMYKYKVVENGEVVEKEMLIDYQNLNEDVKNLIDKKISQNKNRNSEVVRLDKEIKDLKRIYSYSALKIILGEQMKK